MISFRVHGQPQPAGSKRGFYIPKINRVVITDASAKSRPWKALVSDAAIQAMKGRALLREEALVLALQFYVLRPKSHFGKRGLRLAAPAFPAVKPDVSKLTRAVEDALTGIVWRDDAQVVAQIISKDYGEPAGCYVQVRKAGQ